MRNSVRGDCEPRSNWKSTTLGPGHECSFASRCSLLRVLILCFINKFVFLWHALGRKKREWGCGITYSFLGPPQGHLDLTFLPKSSTGWEGSLTKTQSIFSSFMSSLRSWKFSPFFHPSHRILIERANMPLAVEVSLLFNECRCQNESVDEKQISTFCW